MTTADPSGSRVILIGFAKFVDFTPVPAVPENLGRLKSLLRDEAIWGLPGKNITVLTGLQGLSRGALLSRVHKVARQATDTLVVYYVGHGFLDEDDNDNLLLALPGTRKREHFSALPYEEVRRAVRGSGAQRKVVILDCCYSGRAHPNGYLGDSREGQELAHQAPIEGACVLTATSDYARARATSGERYTDFSGALISAMENGIPDAGPYLDIRSVFSHLRGEMRSRGLPRPHLSTRDDGGELVLGRNLAHRESDGAPLKEAVVLPPPVAEPPTRRSRRSVRRRRAVVVTVLAVATALTVTLRFLPETDRPTNAGVCPPGKEQEVELSQADRPGKSTRFPESDISLLHDLTGPTTLIAFEPPMRERTHAVTYLWQPGRQCFATPTGFSSDQLDVSVSPDGKWIAGVDGRGVAGADVVVTDRAGGKRQVIDVPDGVFATHPQWDKNSETLLFTQAPVESKSEYDYPRGAAAVMASLPDVKPTVLALGAAAPYQWGPDHTVAGNFGEQDPLDVRFFDTEGRKRWTIERAGLLGQYGMGAFSPSREQLVTHCPKGQGDNRACVWDSRLGDLLGTYPTGRVFTDRPYGSVGWYDAEHLLMTAWDTKTKWWSAATLDIADPAPGTVADRLTILGRLPDKEGHLSFGPALA